MYEDEGKTDGQSGELAGSLLLVGGAEDHEHEYAGEEHFGKQASDEGYTFLAGIRAGSGEVDVGGEEGQDGGTDDGADDLEQHIEAGVLAAHLAGEPYRESDGGIDVATGDAADGVSHGDDCESEGEGRTDDGGGDSVGATQTDCGAAAHENQDHGSDHFSKILFHNKI